MPPIFFFHIPILDILSWGEIIFKKTLSEHYTDLLFYLQKIIYATRWYPSLRVLSRRWKIKLPFCIRQFSKKLHYQQSRKSIQRHSTSSHVCQQGNIYHPQSWPRLFPFLGIQWRNYWPYPCVRLCTVYISKTKIFENCCYYFRKARSYQWGSFLYTIWQYPFSWLSFFYK